MKKMILLIAAIGIAGYCSAQRHGSDFRNELMFGLKGGFNISNVYDSQGEEFNADAKLGLALGGFMTVPIGKFLGVQPELLLSQKGFRATGRILGGGYNLTRTLTYIDVPLLISLKPSESLTLVAGPQFSYLARKKDTFVNGSTSVAQEQEFQNDNLRKNTLCFTGGVDLNFQYLVLGLRAGWDVKNNNGDGTSTTPRYKNVWYQVTLGYKF